ncbi:MAG: O-antigen ligase family protein [Alcaligenaceae bacterium]|nr:O-antigen ligase family protein [Alcaligenaceae bacterium]
MAATAARMPERFLNRILEGCVLVLTAACAVGLLRFAAGLEPDANFIPLMNRNGTVVLIVLLFPLVFHVHATQGKSRLWLMVCVSLITLCVTLTFSRSGLLGLLAGVILYYWRFSLMGLLKFSAAILVVALFLTSGVAERSTERLMMTGNTLSAMLEGQEVDRSVGDHNRVILVHSAIANAKAHFWFGTGLGMENYRQGLLEAGTPPVTSKAHNFYFSYFAELGLAGFVLLLGILQRIYSGLPALGSRFRAFRVSFLVTALMMTMNEYILLPELWLLMGLLTGIVQRPTPFWTGNKHAQPV